SVSDLLSTYLLYCLLTVARAPRPTLFPYTTLFRSPRTCDGHRVVTPVALVRAEVCNGAQHPHWQAVDDGALGHSMISNCRRTHNLLRQLVLSRRPSLTRSAERSGGGSGDRLNR